MNGMDDSLVEPSARTIGQKNEREDAKRKKRKEDLFAFKTPNICQAFHTSYARGSSRFKEGRAPQTSDESKAENIKIKCLTKRADSS